jgi:hypothetical protein
MKQSQGMKPFTIVISNLTQNKLTISLPAQAQALSQFGRNNNVNFGSQSGKLINKCIALNNIQTVF